MTSTDTTAGAMIVHTVGARVAARRPPGRVAATAYRVATGLIMAVMSLSGVANLVRPERVTDMIHHLGYPDYFPTMLGAAELLGVVALALPGTRRLKEWAYAGFTFDLLAALASHSAVHDGIAEKAGVLAVLLVLAGSYAGHLRRTVLRDLTTAGGAA
jgi:uncharacterized membrane protein YphA (DoxX/SURF4 family)